MTIKVPNGGRRANSGRKPKAATLVKRKIAEHGVIEAEKSFSLFCQWRDDENLPIAVRVECARHVIDRVLGKPSQSVELSGPNKGPIKVKAFDYGLAVAPIAPRPETDSELSGASEGDSDGPPLGENSDGG